MSDVSSASPASSSAPQSSPNQPSKEVSASAPKASTSASESSGIPSVESVTGGAVKSEKASSEAKPADSKPANETAEQKAERKAEEARIKAKVNGKEREYTLEEARRRLELIDGAEEKFQTAAQMRKQVEAFLETLRTDPKKILLNPELGINFRELAEEYLGAEVRKEMMDPVQRELEELRQWKAEQENARKEQETKQKQTEEQRRYEEAKTQKLKEYDVKIAKVLAEANLPKTPYTVKRVAEVLYSAKKKGYDLDLDTAVDFVREGYLTDLQAMTGGLEGEALLKLLGPDIAKRIRQHDLQFLKSKLSPPPAAAVDAAVAGQEQSSKSAPKPDKFMNQDEWKEYIRKKAGL